MNIIFYVIHLILAILCILFGVICLFIPWNLDVRVAITQFINENSLLLSLLGSFLLLIGLAILMNFLLSFKKRTYCIRKGRCSIGVDDQVLHGYLKKYLNDLFPNQETSYHLILRKKNILLSLDIPHMPKIEQESITERIFEDIVEVLSEKIGFSDELKLTVFFQPPPIEAS